MMAQVEYLNLESLREILANDSEKLTKLWRLLANRMMIIHHEKLPQFSMIQQDKIKLLCKMCDVVLYKHGDTFDLSSGGILFKGSITKLKTGSDVGLTPNRKKES